jgi:5'-3' exoribonuclease 2
MLYYYQGCPSWSWYYAYHYTPMASDIHGLSQLSLFFEQAPHWHRTARHWPGMQH